MNNNKNNVTIKNNVTNIRDMFAQAYLNKEFTIDRLGSKTIEIIGASFIANEESIFGTVNQDYVQRELDWYKSMSTSVHDIYGNDKPAPQAWIHSADKDGHINSNYGLLIYSEKYHNQFKQVAQELIKNPDSRRASMIYTRPSIWLEYNENGRSDFICTNSVTYYIRDNKLHCVVQMRSNDAWAGYRNDYAWQKHVLKELLSYISARTGDYDLKLGDIHWQVQNLHVYERNFYLVDHYAQTGVPSITLEKYREWKEDYK